jgi:hypothetical protein
MRTVRIYELDITYPESYQRHLEELAQDEFGDVSRIWSWPQERRFLSRTAAINRAERLAAMGCTVNVRQSAPITFEEAPAAHLDPRPPSPPESECTPEPVALPWETTSDQEEK